MQLLAEEGCFDENIKLTATWTSSLLKIHSVQHGCRIRGHFPMDDGDLLAFDSLVSTIFAHSSIPIVQFPRYLLLVGGEGIRNDEFVIFKTVN